ncbi:MAG TPA: PfkB family carbohydrate kinase, partial [Anaerolineaceae bacterium]|nr:PfkB family carbohydrate kinase [Anaerolineaceae bacterium]
KSVDTTGAGDAFNAGFLAALARGENLSQCLQAGNALAAQVVVVRGGSTLYLPGLDFGIL